MRRLEKQAENTKGLASYVKDFDVYPKSNENPVNTSEQGK